MRMLIGANTTALTRDRCADRERAAFRRAAPEHMSDELLQYRVFAATAGVVKSAAAAH